MFSFSNVLILVALFSSVVLAASFIEDGLLSGEVDLPNTSAYFPMDNGNRIFGGEEAAIGQFPYQISLRRDSRHICGGSIISNRIIITAGHCFRRDINVARLRIVAGAHKNNGNDGTSYAVKRTVIHEHYYVNIIPSNATVINDIALIETTVRIVFNKLVAPIRLHTQFFKDGARAITSGWGRTNDGITNLKFARMRTVTNPQCRTAIGTISNQIPAVHDNSTICAFSGEAGTGVCSGDSGGPLVVKNKLIGITSWALLCARGVPDGFTRISEYIKWINDNMTA